MRERWRKVRRAPGWKVSSEGRVRRNGEEAGQYYDRDGYRVVYIRGERVTVHSLVLEAFVGPRPYGLEACHGESGQRVNALSNLRFATHQENMKDKLRFEMESGSLPAAAVTDVIPGRP